MVDDSEADSDLFEMLLRSKSTLTFPPFDLDIATTGEEAVDYLSSTTPDLLILDINLPDMDGRHLLDLVFKRQTSVSRPPILLVSGHFHPDIEKRYQDYQPLSFFEKSLSIAPNQLKKAILNAIRRD